MASSDKRVVAPALPNPPKEYNSGAFGQLNNVLRLYFRLLNRTVNDLVSGSTVSVKAYIAVSTTYTVAATDYLVECTTGTFTITLLTAVGVVGQEFEIKNSGTGTITVDPAGSETIDGDATKDLVQYDAMKIMSNGTNWIIV